MADINIKGISEIAIVNLVLATPNTAMSFPVVSSCILLNSTTLIVITTVYLTVTTSLTPGIIIPIGPVQNSTLIPTFLIIKTQTIPIGFYSYIYRHPSTEEYSYSNRD